MLRLLMLLLLKRGAGMLAMLTLGLLLGFWIMTELLRAELVLPLTTLSDSIEANGCFNSYCVGVAVSGVPFIPALRGGWF